MSKIQMTCVCGKEYQAREADLKRGWGKSCSKSCASKKREKKTGNYKRFCEMGSQSKNDGHYVGGYDHDFDN